MRDGIFHNPRCSKSRETLKLLQDRRVELPVIDYLQTPPTPAELREICGLLGLKPLQLVRTTEALFVELGLSKDNGYSDAQWIEVLAAHPVIDGHNDAPEQIAERFDGDLSQVDFRNTLQSLGHGSTVMHTDIARLRQGKVGGHHRLHLYM